MGDLWWLYTIVLGGAFALVAQSMAEDLKRRRIEPGNRLFVTGLVWQVFLLLLILQVWVAFTYYQRTVEQIAVVSLIAFIAVPLAIFIMGVLISGNGPGGGDGLTQGEMFDRVRPLFFGTLIVLVVGNIIHETVLGNAAFDSDLLFQTLLVGGGVVGLLSRGRPLDTWLGAAMIAIVGAYILLDYAVVSVVPT